MGFSTLITSNQQKLCLHLGQMSYYPWKLPRETCRKASTFHLPGLYLPLLKVLFQGERITQFALPSHFLNSGTLKDSILQRA